MPAVRTAPKALRAIDWLGGFDQDEEEADEAQQASQGLLALCGCWLDQQGSTYQLLPASAHSLHVYTARPTGRHRFTAHLVRLLLDRNQPRVVWGANRYTLAWGGLDAVSWRGRGEADRYDWVRVA